VAVSINNLRTEVYKYLNESSNSTLGQLPNGQGGTTVTGDNVVKDWIIEGINALCRSCVFYPVVATINVPSQSAAAPITSAASITPNGAQLWYPMDVYVGNTRLTHASEQSIRANDMAYKATAATIESAIKYWYRQDNYRVAVYPYNNTASPVALTVHGAGVPPVPATDDAADYSFIPDDLMKQLVASYVAMMLVFKNTDDPSVAQRAFWGNQYNEGRMNLWQRLDANLRLANQPFSMPPIQVPQR